MSKDRYVDLPPSLQSELTEYSSLIRALRARDTLDISAQLRNPPPQINSKLHTSAEDDDLGSSSSKSAGSPATVPTRRRHSPERKRRRTNDHAWTRWPLRFRDVYVPEWTLEDEIES